MTNLLLGGILVVAFVCWIWAIIYYKRGLKG